MTAAACILCGFVVFGCERNIMNRIVDPSSGIPTGGYGSSWMLYDDDLRTRGTVQYYTDGFDADFACRDNPARGVTCIRFTWDGREVAPYDGQPRENTWVGFGLIVSTDTAVPVSKDLSPWGFTKISFYARASLSTGVSLRAESNNGIFSTPHGTNAWESTMADSARTIDDSWRRYEFSLAGSLANTRDFVRFILKFSPGSSGSSYGNGGTVYLDNIEMVK